jgi:hypothetical protein
VRTIGRDMWQSRWRASGPRPTGEDSLHLAEWHAGSQRLLDGLSVDVIARAAGHQVPFRAVVSRQRAHRAVPYRMSASARLAIRGAAKTPIVPWASDPPVLLIGSHPTTLGGW